jgi:hypothetical protein
MNPYKVGAWCLIFLGLISPIVASGYLFLEYPMALKGFFVPQSPVIRLEVSAFLVAGAICFLFGIILWIVDFTIRRTQGNSQRGYWR